MRIKSQLTAPQVAVERNVDNTLIDAITAVKANLSVLQQSVDSEHLQNIADVLAIDFARVETGLTATENLEVTVVETLDAGEEASAVLNGSVIELRLPKGDDGYTPVKEVDYVDGVDGYTPIKGVDYKDGYTPVKGVDYFDGDKGDPGFTPQLTFRIDETTGELEYQVVNVADSVTPGEW